MDNKISIWIYFIVCLFTGADLSYGAEPANLSPIEKHIINSIDTHKTQQLNLLKKLVNINSGTSNIPGVRKVGEILKKEFNKLGYKTKWVNLPAHMNKAPTLIAEKSKGNGPKIVLIGHLDTVFAKQSKFQKFKQHGDHATGPGVIDDKGGDVVILYALKALEEAQAFKQGTITVILTGDEEDTGKPIAVSRKPLIDAAKNADAALDFEIAFNINSASTSRRGISIWMLSTHGNETHSSDIFKPSVGYGAIFEIARILNTMRSELSNQQYLSFNPGIIIGGTQLNFENAKSQGSIIGKSNVVAKTALAKGDLRYISLEQKNAAIEKIKMIVKNHLLGTHSDIQFEDGMPAMPDTHGNQILLKKYSKVTEDLGYGEVKPFEIGSRGAGDISVIANFVPANLVGLGPVGSDTHSEHETLDIKSLGIQSKKAAILIHRLTQRQ